MASRISNTDALAASLRARSVDRAGRKILIAQLEGSSQSKDFTVPTNCAGFGRIHHFRRSQGDDWPENPLPIDPAQHALNLTSSDSIEAEVFQHGACSWRCWYCYVDYRLLAADRTRGEFIPIEQLVESYLSLPSRPPIIDLSGGQPDLVAEWPIWVINELKRQGRDKDVYVWSDDNLSNDYLWRYLSVDEREQLADTERYGRVGCFKGFDHDSFAFNTSATPDMFDRQFEYLRRLVLDGIDVYGYVTVTTTDARNLAARMRMFVDRVQTEVHPLFPLRTVPLRVRGFTPTLERQRPEHVKAIEIQMEAAAFWREEIEKRFSSTEREKKIFEHRMIDP